MNGDRETGTQSGTDWTKELVTIKERIDRYKKDEVLSGESDDGVLSCLAWWRTNSTDHASLFVCL